MNKQFIELRTCEGWKKFIKNTIFESDIKKLCKEFFGKSFIYHHIEKSKVKDKYK